jgi:hypothetical protein
MIAESLVALKVIVVGSVDGQPVPRRELYRKPGFKALKQAIDAAL